MHLIRASLAISLAATLVFGQASPLRAAEPGQRIREKVEIFGPGADVRVYGSQESPLRGTIQSFDDSGFRIIRGETSKLFRYDEVNVLELTQKSYSAEHGPDPEAARRVATEIGLDRKVSVKTTAGEGFKGKILQMNAEGVSIETKNAGSKAVRYSEMSELKRSQMSTGAKVAIGAGVVVGALLCVLGALVGSYAH